MSAKNPRRAGAQAFPEKKTGLRLVKNPDERARPEPNPELKAMLDDMRRHYRVRCERVERDPGGNEAA